ncbi:hypothetical protein DFJ73DRAFT_768361 [Zopfochytrium polystomum]|nr:hypothetical protein DFJ73DRAFT_768361 [Zopfochytrium polystomum]
MKLFSLLVGVVLLSVTSVAVAAPTPAAATSLQADAASASNAHAPLGGGAHISLTRRVLSFLTIPLSSLRPEKKAKPPTGGQGSRSKTRAARAGGSRKGATAAPRGSPGVEVSRASASSARSPGPRLVGGLVSDRSPNDRRPSDNMFAVAQIGC